MSLLIFFLAQDRKGGERDVELEADRCVPVCVLVEVILVLWMKGWLAFSACALRRLC